MADIEVENTLREIRERVLAESQRLAPAAAAGGGVAAPAADGAGAVGAGGNAGDAGEALARLDANLATTGRAWSRLPPVMSNRGGEAARLELWVKRLIKRAAHWFTWEQVNFNAAVHHALGDARAALAAHEQALARLQSEALAAVRAEAEADRARLSELQSRLARAEERVGAEAAQMRREFAAEFERLAGEVRAAAAEQRTQTDARAAELHAEMRARLDGLLEEQRVCFKQLSLEAAEAAVLHDRARRHVEARLEALETKK
ncbi:MAG TPA: hypothetical protein VF508_07365 [Pyrinomonadaceae bacterium]